MGLVSPPTSQVTAQGTCDWYSVLGKVRLDGLYGPYSPFSTPFLLALGPSSITRDRAIYVFCFTPFFLFHAFCFSFTLGWFCFTGGSFCASGR